VTRLSWLVGPPGAGKSSWTRRQTEYPRVVELNHMLGPLVDPLRLRKGILAANAHLVAAIRAVEMHEENRSHPPLLVVAGLVPEEVLFPARADEEVLLLLPDRDRWELQLRSRPAGAGSSGQYDDFPYSSLWYERFTAWVERGLPLRRVEVPFDRSLVGTVVA